MTLDPKQAKLAAAHEQEGILYALCRDPENGKLYGAGADAAVWCLDPGAKEVKPEKRWTHHDSYVSALVWRDGVVVSGGYDGRLVWTDAAEGKKIREIEAHDGWIRDAVVLGDGSKLASVGDDMLVKIWDAAEGTLLATLDDHPKRTTEGYATALYAVAAAPDGKLLASGDRVGQIRVWDVDSGACVKKFHAPAFYTYDRAKRDRSIGGIRSLNFSADGTRLAVGGIGQVTNVDGFVGPARVEVWDVPSGERVFTGQAKHKAVLNHVAFDPSGTWLVGAGGGDSGGALVFWDLENESPHHLVKPKGHLQQFTFDDGGTTLYACGFAGWQIWRFADEEPAADKDA